MENSRMKEDLLKELEAEKDWVNHHFEVLDPVLANLRTPVASRVFSTLVLLILEISCWLLSVGVLGFCLIRDKVYPFYVLARLRNKAELLGLSNRDVENMYNVVYIIAVAIILLLIIISRNLARIRKKNKLLQQGSKAIKTILGETLNRKAAIAAIEQKHLQYSEPTQTKNNGLEEPNPGF